jgi:hypothetical protein
MWTGWHWLWIGFNGRLLDNDGEILDSTTTGNIIDPVNNCELVYKNSVTVIS